MFTLEPLPRTLEAARRDVRHAKESVRLSSLGDLARLAEGGQAAAVEALERAATRDRAPAVRGQACLALADAGAHGSVEVLLEASEDAHERVRQMAIVALGELAGDAPPDVHERAVVRVEACLSADSAPIRYQALIAWVRLGAADPAAALEAALDDDDAEVRHIALRLLEERWFANGRAPAEAVSAAERALDDESPKVRVLAAVILGRARAPSAPVAIARAVSTREEVDPEDLQMAIELCGELEVTSAAPSLARRAFRSFGLTSDPLSWHARVALAKLGDARARAAILKGLGAWSRDARSLAVVAAGRAGLDEALPALRSMRGDARKAEPSAVAEALTLLEQGRPQGTQ